MPTFFEKMCVCRYDGVSRFTKIWNTFSPSFFFENKIIISNNKIINNNIIIIVQKVARQLSSKIIKKCRYCMLNVINFLYSGVIP